MRMRVFSFGGFALLAAVAVTLLSTPPPEPTRGLSLTSPPAAYAPSIASFVRTHTVLARYWEVRIPPSLPDIMLVETENGFLKPDDGDGRNVFFRPERGDNPPHHLLL